MLLDSPYVIVFILEKDMLIVHGCPLIRAYIQFDRWHETGELAMPVSAKSVME